MAIAFRSESHVVGIGTSVTGTEPTGTVQNDVLIALYIVDSTSGTLGIPSGWTSIYSGVSPTPNYRYNLCYIVRGASAPSLAFTHTGSVYRELFIMSYSGCNTNAPINASVDGGGFTSNPQAPNPPSATATVANAMALAIGIGWNGSASGGWTPPSGYTMRTDNTAGNDVMVASKLLVSAGAEDPGAFGNGTVSGSTDGWQATVILAPAGISVSTLTTGNSGVATTVYTTASVSPSGNALLLLAVAVYIATGSTNPTTPTVTGNGLTWDLVGSVDVDAIGTDRSTIFVFRSMGPSPSTGAITITFVGSNQGKVCWLLDQATGVDTSGANGSGAVLQSQTASTANADVSLSAAFASGIRSGNLGWAAYHVESPTTNAFTAGTGWTTQSTSDTQNYALVYSEIETSNNTIGGSWTVSGRAGLVAVEINTNLGFIPIAWTKSF